VLGGNSPASKLHITKVHGSRQGKYPNPEFPVFSLHSQSEFPCGPRGGFLCKSKTSGGSADTPPSALTAPRSARSRRIDPGRKDSPGSFCAIR